MRPAPDTTFLNTMPMPMAALTEVDAFNSAWAITMPAQLEGHVMPSALFSEPIRGLSTREMDEPEVFRHFFG